MKNYFVATAAAVLCSSIGIAAQGTTATATQSTAAAKPTTTITGCVYQEKDVPGRAPNVAERVGILEDYILAEMNEPASGTATPGATGTAGTAGASTPAMYKLELIEDNKLSAMVGKRVEVTGRVDASANDTTGSAPAQPTSPTDKVIGRDRINLPEFEVTSIREVSGSCPASPAAK